MLIKLHNHVAGLKYCRARAGFTLAQVLLVLVVFSILAALLVGVLQRGQSTARRAECDMHLKTIAIALGVFRQEHGKYPANLQELYSKKYLQNTNLLRCPRDPRPDGTYGDFYAIRAPRDEPTLPVLVCPFHEESGHGGQAYTGRFTSQFSTKPARIAGAANATIQRRGKEPIAAMAGMELYGGDIIRVGTPATVTLSDGSGGLLGGVTGTLDGVLGTKPTLSGSGSATIVFADGSTATLQEGAEVTVLQSFIDGNSSAPLYTLVRQTMGRALYKVHHGSKFDVVTPTATAGARGTEFFVTIHDGGNASVWVEDGQVALTSLTKTIMAPLHEGTLLGGLTGIIPRPED